MDSINSKLFEWQRVTMELAKAESELAAMWQQQAGMHSAEELARARRNVRRLKV